MSQVQVGDLSVHHRSLPVRVDLEAPVVVFVHGLGTDSLASFYLTLVSPIAEAGHQTLCYDLRGHGRSGRPVTGYTLAHFVDDLHGLLDELGVHRPVHLVGNSFGGTIAFAFAHRHRDRVASVVAIEAEPPTAVWRERMADVLSRTRAWFVDEANYGWVAEHYSRHHERLARAAGVRVLQTRMTEEIPTSAVLSADEVESLDVPVLCILGSEGYQSVDPYAVGRMLPRCRTEVIEGQDHSVLVERHELVRRMLVEWIADHERATV